MISQDFPTDCVIEISSDDPGIGSIAQGFIKPAFGYFGAKQRLASRIVEMLPPHNAWVEVFCGSAVVTLNKPRAPIEVVNDLDRNVVNLFTVLRENPAKLCEQVALTPYSRDEFTLARSDEADLEPLEKARRFLVATMMTVNGTSGSVNSGFSYSDSFVRGGREARVNRWYKLPERLEGIIERLRSVRVENKDAVLIVKQYSDRPGTLMYLDPPYLMNRKHTYSIDANDFAFHDSLLKACVASTAMLIISGYENNLYSEYLNSKNGWIEKKILTTTGGTNGVTSERVEMLWTNIHFENAKKSGKVPLELTMSESMEKKVNPARKPIASEIQKNEPGEAISLAAPSYIKQRRKKLIVVDDLHVET